MDRIVFVGPGRIGLALGYALWHAEAVRHLVYCGRRPDPPSHPLFGQGIAEYHFGLMPPPPGTEAIMLTVPDDVLPEMAHALAAQGPQQGCVALHTSGALSTEVLTPLHRVGYAVGSIHPLQAVANPVTGADRLVGSGFAVSGEPPARSLARRIAADLRGEVMEIPVTRRPLYHAAAVLASNGLAALTALSADLLIRAGAEPDRALAALLSLSRGALSEIESLGFERGLTGPVVRGDLETVALHLRALEGDEREVYRALSRVLVRVAEARGLDAAVIGELQALLRPRMGAPFEDAP